MRKDALESIEMNKEKIKMQKQEDEDEDKVIQIYLRVKQRMECLRKKREIEVTYTIITTDFDGFIVV